MAWDSKTPKHDNFNSVYYCYQHALLHAVRYNRFVLDEVLSETSTTAVLQHSIITHCLERGEDGRKILCALRDWWKTGVNDVDALHHSTISPTPDGIPLLEAEELAREREPGDGAIQRSVGDQFEIVL